MSDPVYCNRCDQVIRLERDGGGTHILRCACGKDVSIPETWSYPEWSRKN